MVFDASCFKFSPLLHCQCDVSTGANVLLCDAVGHDDDKVTCAINEYGLPCIATQFVSSVIKNAASEFSKGKLSYTSGLTHCLENRIMAMRCDYFSTRSSAVDNGA